MTGEIRKPLAVFVLAALTSVGLAGAAQPANADVSYSRGRVQTCSSRSRVSRSGA